MTHAHPNDEPAPLIPATSVPPPTSSHAIICSPPAPVSLQEYRQIRLDCATASLDHAPPRPHTEHPSSSTSSQTTKNRDSRTRDCAFRTVPELLGRLVASRALRSLVGACLAFPGSRGEGTDSWVMTTDPDTRVETLVERVPWLRAFLEPVEWGVVALSHPWGEDDDENAQVVYNMWASSGRAKLIAGLQLMAEALEAAERVRRVRRDERVGEVFEALVEMAEGWFEGRGSGGGCVDIEGLGLGREEERRERFCWTTLFRHCFQSLECSFDTRQLREFLVTVEAIVAGDVDEEEDRELRIWKGSKLEVFRYCLYEFCRVVAVAPQCMRTGEVIKALKMYRGISRT